jgi:hypothetical protein
MQRLARIVLTAVSVTVLSVGTSTALASAPTTVSLGQAAVDPTVCKALKSSLVAAMQNPAGRARADAAAVGQIQRFHVADGSDCLLKSYETRPASNVASANYVQGYWKYQTLWVESWNAGSIHVDVGMTITGSIATTSGGWGPNCYFHWNAPAIFGGGITWCGVWNNGNWYTEPGTNYYVWVWPNTWFTRSGYMRYCVEGQGVSCSPWGALN